MVSIKAPNHKYFSGPQNYNPDQAQFEALSPKNPNLGPSSWRKESP